MQNKQSLLLRNQIPKNWQKVKLGDILIEDPQYGYTASSSKSKVGPKLLRITDIQGDFVNWDDVPYCEIPDLDKQKYILMEGDIVFARTGNTTGANYFIKKLSIDEAVFASYLIRIRPDPIKCLPGYLAYFLRSKNYWKQVNSLLSGSAQPGINATLLKEFTFYLPNDIKYQRDIVAILSAFDDKIEVNNKIAKNLEEIAQALFKEWFINFKFPGYEKVKMVDSPLGKIPEGWQVVKVGEALETLGGGTPSREKSEYWKNGTITWFSPTDLTKNNNLFIFHSDNRVTKLGLQKSSAKLFPPYSLMMTSRATIGVTAINTKESCTNQGFIVCVPNETLSVYYLYFWINKIKEEIINIASGATFKEISRGEFRELNILIPESNTHQKFVEIMQPSFQLIENLISQNMNLKQARDLLLPKLMKGEIQV